MKHIDLEERRNKILFSVIDSYIETAQPVGSRAISHRFRNAMSPATIRNVMADLEETGLITHPHTSAGRIPTDKGYRFYVTYLLEPKHLTKDEEVLISKLLNRQYDDIEQLMQNASKVLSLITNVAGIVITPRLKRSLFKHIEFIQINHDRLLAVLITSSGLIKNTMLDLEEEIEKPELLRISEFLNQELDGIFLGDIKKYLTHRLFEQRDSFYTFLKKAMDIVSSPNLLKMEDRLYYDGAASIMSLPEFSRDVSKTRLLLKVFEDKKEIMDLFNEDMEIEGIKVHIGRENSCKYMQDCSIVTCNYKIKDKAIGALGVVGPTRMEYGRIISCVSYISELLGKVLEDIG